MADGPGLDSGPFRWHYKGVQRLIGFAPLLFSASLAVAQPVTVPLTTAQLDLAGNGTQEQVAVHGDGRVTVSRGEATLGELRLPGVPSEAHIERKEAGKRPYLWIQGTTKTGQVLLVAALRGQALREVYSGPIGRVGKDGERSLTVVAGPEGLVRYQAAPGVVRCDGEGRLFAETFDERAGWRPLLPPPPMGPRLSPVAQPKGLPAAPLPVYHFTAASSQAGVADRADLLTPPRELEDGRAETAWRIAGEARGAWVTSRAEGSGRSVVALRIAPATQRPGVPRVRSPRTLAAVFADGKSVVFDLLPGERPQWVRLPRPVASPCVSLVVVQGAAGLGKNEQTGLGEAGVYSDLDGQGPAGLARIAAGEEYVAGEGAARALLLLGEGRPGEALGAIGEALTGASGPGRRRLHGVLIQLAGRMKGDPGAAGQSAAGQTAGLLVRAIGTAPSEERPPLWMALSGLGEAGDAPLLALARDPSQPAALRGEALRRLGERGTATLARMLVKLDDTSLPRAARRGLIAGLSAAMRCLPPDDPRGQPVRDTLLAMWQSEAPDLRQEADLVEALASGAARCPDRRTAERATAALVKSWRSLRPGDGTGGTTTAGSGVLGTATAGSGIAGNNENEAAFLLRYRVLSGLGQLAMATPESAALLKEVFLKESDPVLRRAAAGAAAVLSGPENGELARRGLADSDPSVRLAALSGLGDRRDAATVVAVEQALAGDRWPQVRRAAVEVRTAACAQRPGDEVSSLRRALRDADGEVRRLALSGLARCQGKGAAGILAETAKNPGAAPELRGQACALLAAVQGPAAQPVLSETLLDALQDPTATEKHAALAATCARALGQVGDAGALPALAQAVKEPLSPEIRLAAVESLGSLCQRTPKAPTLQLILKTAIQDEDARVRAAAARSLSRCR